MGQRFKPTLKQHCYQFNHRLWSKLVKPVEIWLYIQTSRVQVTPGNTVIFSQPIHMSAAVTSAQGWNVSSLGNLYSNFFAHNMSTVRNIPTAISTTINNSAFPTVGSNLATARSTAAQLAANNFPNVIPDLGMSTFIYRWMDKWTFINVGTTAMEIEYCNALPRRDSGIQQCFINQNTGNYVTQVAFNEGPPRVDRYADAEYQIVNSIATFRQNKVLTNWYKLVNHGRTVVQPGCHFVFYTISRNKHLKWTEWLTDWLTTPTTTGQYAYGQMKGLTKYALFKVQGHVGASVNSVVGSSYPEVGAVNFSYCVESNIRYQTNSTTNRQFHGPWTMGAAVGINAVQSNMVAGALGAQLDFSVAPVNACCQSERF